jgi:VanZ family protein
MNMPARSDEYPEFSKVVVGFFSLLYLVMLVYGTLYPYQGWSVPEGGFLPNFLEADMSRLSVTDMVTNVLIYIPAGLLWAGYLAPRLKWYWAILWATVLGTGLSLGLEIMQVFLPSRISALSDLLLNGLGSIIGAGAALIIFGQARSGLWLRNIRNNIFVSGMLANIGLIVLGLWVLSQLSPLVPSISISNLRDGIKPVWFTVTGQSAFIVSQSIEYFCSVIALGGIFMSLSRSRGTGLILFALLIAAVLLLKIPVLSRQLSFEAMFGCASALIILVLLHRIPSKSLISFAGIFLLSSFIVGALRGSEFSAQTFAFNWIPFKGHMQNIVGLANILASGWVFLGLGYIARYLCRPSAALGVTVTGFFFGCRSRGTNGVHAAWNSRQSSRCD